MFAEVDSLVTLTAALGGAVVGGGAALAGTVWERRAERREARANRVRDAILDAQAKAIVVYLLAQERPTDLDLLLDRAEAELGQARTALFLDPFVEDEQLREALDECWSSTSALSKAARLGTQTEDDFVRFDAAYDSLSAKVRRYLVDLVS